MAAAVPLFFSVDLCGALRYHEADKNNCIYRSALHGKTD